MSPAPRRALPLRRKLLFSLLPGFALLVSSGIVGEIVLRTRHASLQQITGVAPWKPGQWEELTYHWDEYHPRLGWTNVAGYRSDHRVPFDVQINGQGLRADRDYLPEASAGTCRIAVFGDSCTFGEEVDGDQTVPYFLEQCLENGEVLNFGVHGYGLGQMVLRMEEEVAAFAPDLVLFIVLLPSDLTRDAVPEFIHAKPSFAVEEGELVIHNVPVPEASQQPWWVRHSYLIAWLLARPTELDSADQVAVGKALELGQRLLQRASESLARQGVPLLVTTLATAGTISQMLSDPDVRAGIEAMRAGIIATGVPTLDRIGFMGKQYSERGAGLLAPKGHWSGPGNCLLAREIATAVAQMLPRARLSPHPPSCASPDPAE